MLDESTDLDCNKKSESVLFFMKERNDAKSREDAGTITTILHHLERMYCCLWGVSKGTGIVLKCCSGAIFIL